MYGLGSRRAGGWPLWGVTMSCPRPSDRQQRHPWAPPAPKLQLFWAQPQYKTFMLLHHQLPPLQYPHYQWPAHKFNRYDLVEWISKLNPKELAGLKTLQQSLAWDLGQVVAVLTFECWSEALTRHILPFLLSSFSVHTWCWWWFKRKFTNVCVSAWHSIDYQLTWYL